MDRQDDRVAAARLEQAGDDALARGLPARSQFLAAQKLLMPTGAVWSDADEYRIHMDAFERLQQKIYSLEAELLSPGTPACVSADPDPLPAPAPQPAPDVPEWQTAAIQGRLKEAAALLSPLIASTAGMGGYLTLGRASETRADELNSLGDTDGARLVYAKALESYLGYALFPGRGDHEDEGYARAARVAGKMQRLENAGDA